VASIYARHPDIVVRISRRNTPPRPSQRASRSSVLIQVPVTPLTFTILVVVLVMFGVQAF
jgi:hypothetical protein